MYLQYFWYYLQQRVEFPIFLSRKNVGCSRSHGVHVRYKYHRIIHNVKRPLSHTYVYLQRQLAGKELSWRKKVCMQYFKWGMTKSKADRGKLVEMAKQWRKEENKIGSQRTLLERKVRKLFRVVKRDKTLEEVAKNMRKEALKAVKKGTGVHSPEQQALRAERNREIARRKKEAGVVWAHHWIVYPPEGEPMKIYNLCAFCREHGLNQSHMCRTALDPKRRKHHKGWRAEKYDPIWDNIQ
jgi:hypothetical protein